MAEQSKLDEGWDDVLGASPAPGIPQPIEGPDKSPVPPAPMFGTTSVDRDSQDDVLEGVPPPARGAPAKPAPAAVPVPAAKPATAAEPGGPSVPRSSPVGLWVAAAGLGLAIVGGAAFFGGGSSNEQQPQPATALVEPTPQTDEESAVAAAPTPPPPATAPAKPAEEPADHDPQESEPDEASPPAKAEPSPKPPKNQPGAVDAAYAKSSSTYDEASAEYESSGSNEALQTMVLSACEMDDGAKARQAFRKLKGTQERSSAMASCSERNIDLTLKISGPTPAELLVQARRKLAASDFQGAYDLAKDSNSRQRDSEALSVMAQSSCGLGETETADRLRGMLLPKERDTVTAFCAKVGAELQ